MAGRARAIMGQRMNNAARRCNPPVKSGQTRNRNDLNRRFPVTIQAQGKKGSPVSSHSASRIVIAA